MMPTRKRSKRKPEQLKKKADTPEMKVVSEKPGPMIKSDFIDVVTKQDEPKPILEDRKPKPVQEVKESKQEYIERHTSLPKETTDYKVESPHYISERIIGNDQLANIADTFNKRFKAGYRFKALIPLRGNESIAIYEKIKTIEFKQHGSTIQGSTINSYGPDGGYGRDGSKRYDPK